MIPGSNILKMALTIIAKQSVLYYSEIDRQLNEVGQYITEYSPVATLSGSLQPVPRNLYERYGLDLQKSYFIFYILTNAVGIERGRSGDQIVADGNRYQFESPNDWFFQDGWQGMLCVFIGPEFVPYFGFNTVPSSTTNVNFTNGNFINQ